MTYDRFKVLTAITSLTSLGVAIYAFVNTGGPDSSYSIIAASLAGISAALTIYTSQKLAHARNQKRVFIIYAREDEVAARKLATELRQNGFNTWFDQDELEPGEIWQKTILKALEE